MVDALTVVITDHVPENPGVSGGKNASSIEMVPPDVVPELCNHRFNCSCCPLKMSVWPFPAVAASCILNGANGMGCVIDIYALTLLMTVTRSTMASASEPAVMLRTVMTADPLPGKAFRLYDPDVPAD